MSKKPQTNPDQVAGESLWAISSEGIIWQINPRNRNAAPVLHLDELDELERESFQQQVLQHWEGLRSRESLPDDIKKVVTEIGLARPLRR